MPIIFLSAVLAILAFTFYRKFYAVVIVYDHQTGLRYRNGKLEAVLQAGRYTIFRPKDAIYLQDMRERVLSVVNQEIICADNLAVRLSASVICKIADAALMARTTANFTELLYLDAQLAMREVSAGLKLEEVLAKRNELSAVFLEKLTPRASAIGIQIVSGGIRDVTLPADVRKIFAQVAQSEKAAEASLAKSRAETASLRSLANAAKMMENNPALATLRTLQSVSEVAAGSGNTIVFGMPSPMVPFLPNAQKTTSTKSDFES